MSTKELAIDFGIRKELQGSPDEYVRVIESLLDAEHFAAARQIASRAAELFAEHPWLSKVNRVLNPSRAVSHPGQAPGRQREFTWLRQNSPSYPGQWVALLGDELIAHSESFDDVLREVESLQLPERPLFHRVD